MDYPSTSSDNNATNVSIKTRVDSCFVPMCPSTSTKFPNKIFLTGPSDPNLRNKWLEAAQREESFSPKTVIRCCEDHFDLEKDVENWMKYKMIGGKLFLKKDVVPHFFECQNRMMPIKPTSAELKRKRHEILESIENTPDDPDDPPERAPPPPADPTLALTCDSDPGVATQDQTVPTLPAPAEKDVENRCKDCAEVNEGFWFWCVECSCGALCGACAGRPPHHRHHVLRAPITADTTQTQAVLMVIRQQLLNENLLSQHETADDGLKVEVKEEPPDAPPAEPEPEPGPEPPQEPDPLACEPHENQCIAEQIVDHPQPLKLPQLPEAHAHKQNLLLDTKLVKVPPTQVKRKFVFHLEKILTTQQLVKGLQTKFPTCKENLVPQPSKAREYQVPKSLLKPLTSSRSQTGGSVTGIIRHNQARTQAPIKVTSEPQPSETVIIDLDEDETVEYLEEGLESDIETVEEVVLDDNETSEDDNRVTNDDDVLDDRETNDDDVLDDRETNDDDVLDDRETNDDDALDDRETNDDDVLDDRETNDDDVLDDRETNDDDGLDDRETNEDDDGLDDRDDDVLDEDYLVDEDDLSEDDESDEDTIENLARKGVKRIQYLKKRNSGQTVLLPLDSIVREDELMKDQSDEDPIVNIAGRGVKRKEDEEETSPVPPHGSVAQELPSKVVVQVRPLSSLEIRNWTADRKRRRKH